MKIVMRKRDALLVVLAAEDDNQGTPFRLIVDDDGKLSIRVGTSPLEMPFDMVVKVYNEYRKSIIDRR